MKKQLERENTSAQPEQPATELDVMGMLKKIQQHLVFLERKIDTLIAGRPPESSSGNRHFPEHRKHFGNSFRPDRGNFRPHSGQGNFHRERENRSFEGRPQGNVDRPHPGNPSRERPFDRPRANGGDRSFHGKSHFSRHPKGPPRRSF